MPGTTFASIEAAISNLRSGWRFRWPAIAVAWVGCAIGWCAVFAVPPSYQTTARVYVDANSLLRPLLQGLAIPPNTINQVELVRQALLARPQLEQVIDSTELKSRAKTALEREAMVQRLATEITIRAQAQGNPNREAVATLYTISYKDGDSNTSYAVVTQLLQSFVSQSLGANESGVNMAERFLVDQLRDYEKRLSDSEMQLAEFKRQNVGAMPDERGGYFSRTQNEMIELDRLRAAMTVAVNKQTELRNKLLGGDGSQSGPDVGVGTLESSVDGRILEGKRQLEDLLMRFTESHPDVLATKEAIARLEDQRKNELASLRSNRGVLGAPRGSSTSVVAQNLQIALNETELEIAGLRAQVADRQRRVSELRDKINTLPEVEAELARLTRDYDVTKTQYDALLQRLESAKLSGRADRKDDLRIRVIEPPVKPLAPSSPKLLLLLSGVLFGSLAAGVAVAVLRATLHPVFLGVKQLTEFCGIPALGAIDLIDHESARRDEKRQLVFAAIAIVGLFLAYGLVLVSAPSAQQALVSLRSNSR